MIEAEELPQNPGKNNIKHSRGKTETSFIRFLINANFHVASFSFIMWFRIKERNKPSLDCLLQDISGLD